MSTINESSSDGLTISQQATPSVTPAFYGTTEEGDLYFTRRPLSGSAWTDATSANKQAALIEATDRIDRLNFVGNKTDPNQFLQFPRDLDTTVPDNIRYATYELAKTLLDGVDPDEEIRNLVVTSHGYSSARTSYDRNISLAHVVAGIPNAKAWAYILPYLRDPNELTLSRTV